MMSPTKILLQTTIPHTEDDWHIGRFSLLAAHLRSLTDAGGSPLYDVTARDHEMDETGNDPVLSSLGESDVDQLWLFAVDTGIGLTSADCSGITSFRKRGGGIFSTRDHFDLGSSLCTLGGIGAAHYFHSINPDPNPDRNRRDDVATTDIDYPNYHSGANGDYQQIDVVEPHDLLRRPDGSLIQFFPAHPHEGGVGVPDESARVIAASTSKVTGRPFNLIVAFENSVDRHGNNCGRAIAESSFHHVADYNWNTDLGCPSFVAEAPGDGYKRNPKALDDIRQYVANVAAWLSPR
ncbi:MAG TPA: hypothetical protein VMZ26_05405 [Pyrinomonadaceae bacterium]|nr:hypothetical protein [Pyrinomonadaceae bacterium]